MVLVFSYDADRAIHEKDAFETTIHIKEEVVEAFLSLSGNIYAGLNKK